MESNVVAPYILRAYAWEVLKANTDMRETHYEGKVPIVPLAEEADISKYGKPHVIYAFSEDMPERFSARSVGGMAFVVNSDRVSELTKVVNVLTRTFEREDEVARDINEYSSTIPTFIGIRFATITTTFVEVDKPEDSEGGTMQGVVNIRYEYYHNYDNLVTSIAHWDGTKYVKN